MRRFDWLVIILLVVGAIGGKLYNPDTGLPENSNPRRPAIEHFSKDIWDAETRKWLSTGPAIQQQPAFVGRLPREGIIEDNGSTSSSVGSAFSVSKSGVWLTARHVVEGCSTTALQKDRKKYVRVDKVFKHPEADVALLITAGGPEELRLVGENNNRNDSYNIGFPTGQPGAVHARFIGEMTLRHVNKRQRHKSYRERVNAWAELTRIPDIRGSLGGLSGGAVLNEQGRVIGIVQAESARRGRIMTAQTSTIKDMFKIANVPYPATTTGQTSLKLSKKDYPNTARGLITSLRVAKVFCIVE